jgi:hypothetical protein
MVFNSESPGIHGTLASPTAYAMPDWSIVTKAWTLL